MKHNTLWQTTWSKTNYDVLSIGSSNHDSDSADLEKKLTVGIVSVFGAILVGTIIVSLKKMCSEKDDPLLSSATEMHDYSGGVRVEGAGCFGKLFCCRRGRSYEEERSI